MARKLSLSRSPGQKSFDEYDFHGVDHELGYLEGRGGGGYGDDVVEQESPRETCFGYDKSLCFSSRLHGSVFVLSIIFMGFHLLATAASWGSYAHFDAKRDPFGHLFFLSISATLRLILSIVLFIACLTRRNCWIMLYIAGVFVALAVFCVGLSRSNNLLLLCSPLLLVSDLVMFYILKKFIVENQHVPTILTEQKQRYHRAITKVLQEGDEQAEMETIKTGVLKSLKSSKRKSHQHHRHHHHNNPRAEASTGTIGNKSLLSPGQGTAQSQSKGLMMNKGEKSLYNTRNVWKHLAAKGQHPNWPNLMNFPPPKGNLKTGTMGNANINAKEPDPPLPP